MERVLKAVPADLRVKMEALVHDLTLALEESSNSANVRRRWGIRRRARSTGNIRKFTVRFYKAYRGSLPRLSFYKYQSSLNISKHSDDSSSSICDIRILKNSTPSKYQSDSDDTNQTKRFARFSNLNNVSNIESDSVNENFIPRTNTRRKRKFKKMAVDSDSNPSTSQTVTIMSTTLGGKKRVLRNDCKNKYGAIWCGKRKRSCRERSTDCEMRSLKPNRTSKSKIRGKIQGEDTVDCSRISSSSISSSDSENGIITNDEDREGDDEQSDWIVESNWWDDGDSTSEDKLGTDSTFQMILHGSFEHSTDESRKRYRQRVKRIREGLTGREIRAGRRHVDNKPGYSIITSANEKVSRFLQDPTQSELKLHPMRQAEREKLRRLANLYSLSLKGDLGCPILYKTRHTTQAVCVDQVSLNRFSDYKRLRKTPPNSPNPDSMMQCQEQHISSTNFGSQIVQQTQDTMPLQSISFPQFEWDSNNMEIEIHGKPKFQDFGHSKSS
ncbi:G patch domain-containing protein 2-like isoform X1 [Vespa mandarinia]|uniref:G patch domain-containing protein 2-like isoform X1 n=1 Tax=Vespa mandarinia TaxID=7446 RepID=UPI00161F9041|nr:G patch domain-containing protein 2-like isoform X1 [Vespa mandarinia]XP_047343880.1 G patch domain-containing protein 2 isoform X1 [Vespa velutina]